MVYIWYIIILLEGVKATEGQSNDVKHGSSLVNVTNMRYLRKKWKAWYDFDDVNHKSCISIDDVELGISEFISASNLIGGEAKSVSDALKQWWKTNFLSGKERITRELFMENIEDQFSRNKKAFVRWRTDISLTLYSLVDIDNDGEFSIEEFVNGMIVFGHKNMINLRNLFEAMNPKHGKLPIMDVLDYWIIFASDDDPNKEDPVKDYFEKELNITINK